MQYPVPEPTQSIAPCGRCHEEERRPIADTRGVELRFDAGKKTRDVAGARISAGAQRHRPASAREPQFVNRSRKRFRETGHGRDRTEVREFSGGNGVERHARGHRFRVGLRAGDPAGGGGLERGGAGRKLDQAEPMHAKGRAATRDSAREIIGGAARRGDDDQFSRWRETIDEGVGGGEAGASRRGGLDLHARLHRRHAGRKHTTALRRRATHGSATLP